MALGRKWFGKIAVQLFGREKWDNQDASRIWSDGGAIRQELEPLIAKLEAVVADNAKLAVSDFASTGTAALRAGDGGEVILGVRIEAGDGLPSQIIEIPLRALVMAALLEIRPSLGVDEQAQGMLSSLVAFGQQLAALGQPPRARPQPQQAQAQIPAPPIIQGGRRTHQDMAAPSISPRKMAELQTPSKDWTAATFAELGRTIAE